MITYLFGAGASAQAVPVVRDIPADIDNLIKKLYDVTYYPNEAYFSNKKQRWFHDYGESYSFDEDVQFPIRQGISHNLLRLKEIIGTSYSIDTVGKRFFMLEDERVHYEEYKRLIVLWMTLTQAFNKPDPRYELFLATVLNRPHEGVPEGKLNLISWNYDMQMEMAFASFLNTVDIAHAVQMLGIYSKYNFIQRQRSTSNEHPVFFKINGSCSSRSPKQNVIFDYYASKINGEPKKQLLNEVLTNFTNRYPADLSFAWETESYFEKALETYCKRIEQSKAMVIIGYSFPTFNRQIDKRLLEAANKNGIKIYIQDKNPKAIADKLIMNFGVGLHQIEKLDKSNLGEFFIPPEYDQI